MNEIEIEFKNLLTRDEYTLLKQHYFNNFKPKVQTNYYFETDGFQLKERHMALRIRENSQGFIATLKQPHDEGLLETHDQLTEKEARAWLKDQVHLPPNIKTKLLDAGINIDQIRLKGQLTTHRCQRKDGRFLIVLDHSLYNKTEDYELEVEAPSYKEGEAYFNQLLHQFNIETKPTPNKIQRFFNSIEGL